MRLSRFACVPLLCSSTAVITVVGSMTPSFAADRSSYRACTGKATVSCTFFYNGTNGADGVAQTWRVPAGVRSARFTLYGAQGGGSDGVSTGGLGGETVGTVALIPGSVVTLMVGGRGTFTGGFNGGGTPQNSNDSFGGGGASDIRVGGRSLPDRVLVAGGGGGGADMCTNSQCSRGGAGGGRQGQTGTTSSPGGVSAGTGGTQSRGGTGAAGGLSGSRGLGGGASNFGGSGGGGYFGGGGGGFSYPTAGGGGGGSSYFSPNTSRVWNAWTKAGVRGYDGMIVITYTKAA